MSLIVRLRRCCQEREQVAQEQTGLSSAEYGCMAVFPPTQSISSSELAELVQLSPSRVSRVVDRLVRRGLVERRTSETNRRAVELRLTDTGRTTQTELEGCLRECGNELRNQLSTQEMFTAAAGLSILLGAMEQE